MADVLHPASDDVGDLAGRLLRLLRAQDRGTDEIERLSVELRQVARCPDGQKKLEILVAKLSESQTALRGRHSRALGDFCRSLLELLGSSRHQWPTQLAGLRLLEGVLLVLPPDDEIERRALCWTIQSLLKAFLPRLATARLESAAMSLSCAEVRSICAPDRSPVSDSAEFSDLVGSFRPSATKTSNLREAYTVFDDVIYRTFGVHGQRFGSTVNGFQLQGSDLDVVVLLPTEVRQSLIEQAKERRRACDVAGGSEAGEGAEDWSFVSSGRLVKVASTMAARGLAVSLRSAGLNVVEVVEQARVPIVKCKYVVKASRGASGTAEDGIDVDISFCNEVAYHNSRLLRAYSEFDSRVQSLVILVKLWAKRRLLNSVLEGTLSSYAYSIMVIHFLQARGILPNLQHPSDEALREFKGLVHEKVIEGGHNVWFLQPDKVGEATIDPGQARMWLGADPPGDSLAELLYGFFRYFALEFNLYADVVSIRLLGRASKADYFADLIRGQADGSDGGDASDVGDTEAQVVAEADESVSRELAPGHRMSRGDAGDSDGEEADEEVVFPVAPASPVDESALFSPGPMGHTALPSEPADPVPRREDVAIPGGRETPAVPQRFAGMLANYGEDAGWGVITPERTGNPTSMSGEVFVSRKELERSGLTMFASCTFSLCKGARGKLQACDVQPTSVLNERSDVRPVSTLVQDASTALAPDLAPFMARASVPESAGASEPGPCFEGTVKSFQPDHGWGFISCEGTEKKFGRDVFLHQKQNQGFAVGDRVRFSVELNHKSQPQARQVRKVGHSEEQCEEDLAHHTVAIERELEAGTPASETLCPTLSREEYAAQKQLKNRQCLCIDDPMERFRTLGPTFGGQELISKEMRRALSIFRRGGEGIAMKLLEEKDAKSVKRQAWTRDLSPVPEITRTGVHVEREVKREWCGKIIGKGGCVATRIKQEFGLDDFHIQELPKGSFLHYRGSPRAVAAAMRRVEEIVSGSGRPKDSSRAQRARWRKGAESSSVTYYAERAPTPSLVPSSVASSVADGSPGAGTAGLEAATSAISLAVKKKNKISPKWQ